MSKLTQLYNSQDYEPLIPTASKPDQYVYKFNSPQHFVSWVQHLDETFPRASPHSSSKEGSTNFCMSESLEDAYKQIRETKFESTDNTSIESKLAKLRTNTMYSDEGHELEVAEYLAGSDKVWLKNKHIEKPTRLIDDMLMIDVDYSAGRKADIIKKLGIMTLESIYRRRIVPRKLVVAFAATNVIGGSKETFLTTIDVAFSDLNGIAKMLHPSAFRRLWFRLVEQYPDLYSGYGRPNADVTSKGFISLERIYDTHDDPKRFEKQIDKFIGITK